MATSSIFATFKLVDKNQIKELTDSNAVWKDEFNDLSTKKLDQDIEDFARECLGGNR